MSSTRIVTPVSADAILAGVLFAIDPAGLGGVVLRCGPGPGRDRWAAAVCALLPKGAPVRRVPIRIEDERLLGGLDLAASLAAGRAIAQRGVLAEANEGIVFLAMAERIDNATAARLAAVLDQGEVVIERDGLAMRLPAEIGVIALDEGLAPKSAHRKPCWNAWRFAWIRTRWSTSPMMSPMTCARLNVQEFVWPPWARPATTSSRRSASSLGRSA